MPQTTDLSGPMHRALPVYDPGAFTLNKSIIDAATQCDRRVGYQIHDPESRDPVGDEALYLMEQGKLLEGMVPELYPEAERVPWEQLTHDEAVARTLAMMEDPEVDVILEAAFDDGSSKIRVDVLERAPDGGWTIRDVVASSSVKPHHLMHLAYQVNVLINSGTEIYEAAFLMPNKDYVLDGDLDAEQFFVEFDATDDVFANLDQARGLVTRVLDISQDPNLPQIEVGSHCNKPHTCPFHDACHDLLPEHHITSLPRLTAKQRYALLVENIRTVSDISVDWTGFDMNGDAAQLNPKQVRVRNSIVSDTPYFDQEGLSHALSALIYPVRFIDFEAAQPAIPLVQGTRPFQRIPFQFSLHTLHEDGRMEHSEYLATSVDHDIRREFLEHLVEFCGEGDGSIVVYSPYERSTLSMLEEDYPEFERFFSRFRTHEFDLLPIVRDHLYFPSMKGSWSIKKVLPAVVPDMNYDDLDIQNGAQASMLWLMASDPSCLQGDRERIHEGLLKYCGRDTYAMVELAAGLHPPVSEILSVATKRKSSKRGSIRM